MPNQPATPAYTLRIPDEIMEGLRWHADDRGETFTDVALLAFREFLRNHPPGRP